MQIFDLYIGIATFDNYSLYCILLEFACWEATLGHRVGPRHPHTRVENILLTDCRRECEESQDSLEEESLHLVFKFKKSAYFVTD